MWSFQIYQNSLFAQANLWTVEAIFFGGKSIKKTQSRRNWLMRGIFCSALKFDSTFVFETLSTLPNFQYSITFLLKATPLW